MRTKWRTVSLVLALSLLSACQHALQTHSRTALHGAQEGEQDTQQIALLLKNLAGLKLESSSSADERSQSLRRLRLCQSEPARFDCTGPSPSVDTRDLGFIPATLSIESVELTNIRETPEGWAAIGRIEPLINGVSPWCRSGTFSLEVDTQSGRTRTLLESTWCNWLLYGNVALELAFSAEEINLARGSIAGFYELRVKGTSNAGASGYLLASIE